MLKSADKDATAALIGVTIVVYTYLSRKKKKKRLLTSFIGIRQP